MGNGQRKSRPHERADKHDQQSGEINSQLEHDKTLDILIQRASPHDSRDDATERIVKQCNVTGFLGYRSPRPHRQADLGKVQRRSIVRPVAGYSYDFSLRLQQLHQPLLVQRTGTAHHLQILDTLQGFFIAQRSKVNAPHAILLLVVSFFPQTDLTGYFHCGARAVSRHDLDLHPGFQTVLHGLGHFRTHRVANGRQAQQGQPAGLYQSRTIGIRIRHFLVGQQHSTLRVHLPVFQPGMIPGNLLFRSPPAKSQNDFGRPFHIYNLSSQHGGSHYRSHIFPL